eukprot:gene26250-17350_t
MLHIFPYSWEQALGTTRLEEEAHFIKHKAGKGSQKESLGAHKSAKEHPHKGQTTEKKANKAHTTARHAGTGMLSGLLGKNPLGAPPGHDRGHAQGGAGGAP